VGLVVSCGSISVSVALGAGWVGKGSVLVSKGESWVVLTPFEVVDWQADTMMEMEINRKNQVATLITI
jgi:hypothetical protein